MKMRKTITICVVGLLIGTGFMMVVSNDVKAETAGSIWTKKTEMNILPDSDGWSLIEDCVGNCASVSNGILTIDTMGESKTAGWYYEKGWEADNSVGVTVKIKAQMVSAETGLPNLRLGFYVAVLDGTKVGVLQIGIDKIGIGADGKPLLLYYMDTTSDFHEYMLTMKGSDIMVYVDGVLRIDGTGYANVSWAGNKVYFGDTSGASKVKCCVDYIYYTAKGVFPPTSLPPIADAGPDQTIYTDEIISFDGSGSYGTDGTIINYTWDLGDENTSYGVTTTYAYPNAGVYNVTLTVTDNHGQTGTDTCKITVKPRPDLTLTSPDISFSPKNPIEGDLVTINATIHNINEGNAENAGIAFYCNENLIGTTNAYISGYSQENVSITWNTVGLAGNHTIRVVADPDNVYPELNETNNEADKEITVRTVDSYTEYLNETIQGFSVNDFDYPNENNKEKWVENKKKEFSNRLDAVLSSINNGEYESAIDQLESLKNTINNIIKNETAKEELIKMVDSILNSDVDGDCLTFYDEGKTYYTDPYNADTDNDFMPDGWEVYYGLNPLHDGTCIYSYNNDKTYTKTSNLNPDEGVDGDFDNDDLKNSEEYNYTYRVFENEIKMYKIGYVFGRGLDPKNNDTDNDELEDGIEVKEYFTLYEKINEIWNTKNASEEAGGGVFLLNLTRWLYASTEYLTNYSSEAEWLVPILYKGHYKINVISFTYENFVVYDAYGNPEFTASGGYAPEINMTLKSETGDISVTDYTVNRTFICNWNGCDCVWNNYTFETDVVNALYNITISLWWGNLSIPHLYVLYLQMEKQGLDPLNPDTDYDEIEDGNETMYGTNPLKSDTDDDGLRDIVEINMGLDPCNPDTDDDGVWDGHDLQPNMNWSNFQWQNKFQPGMINYTQEFHVYHSSNNRPSDTTVRNKIYSLCGTNFTITGIDYLGLNNSYHNEDGTDWGSWTFYEYMFNLTFENAVNIPTNGYDYALLELPFKANREQTVTIQLSTHDTGYTYDNKWRRIGFYYVLYEDKNFRKVYESISVSSNLNKGGVQVDMTIPREFAPSVDKTMVLQITPVWVYGNKTGVSSMNFLGYRYWDMMTESHIYYNDAAEFKIASVTMNVHHLSYIVLARPSVNLTMLNQTVSGSDVGSYIESAADYPETSRYVALYNLDEDSYFYDSESFLYITNARSSYDELSSDMVDVAKQGTVKGPGAGSSWKTYNIDAVVLVSYDRHLLYDSFSLIQSWSGVWSEVVDDSDCTDYYFGDGIIVNNDEFVSLENVIEQRGDDASVLEPIVVGTEYISTPPAAIHDAPVATFDDTIIAKKYQYEQPDGDTVDVYEVNIYTKSKKSEMTDSISGSIDFLTFAGTNLVTKVYVARAVSSGSLTQKLPQIKLVTTTWSRISTGLTVAAAGITIAVTAHEMVIAYQEGDYLRMSVIGVSGTMFTTSILLPEIASIVGIEAKIAGMWSGGLAGIGFSVLAGYCADMAWDAYNKGDELAGDYYRDQAIGYSIDAALIFGVTIATAGIGTPVILAAEGIVAGVSVLLCYFNVIDQTYTIGTLAVSAWYALWGLPDPQQQMEYASNAFEWLSDWMSGETYPCMYVGSTP